MQDFYAKKKANFENVCVCIWRPNFYPCFKNILMNKNISFEFSLFIPVRPHTQTLWAEFIPDQNVTGKWLDVRVRLSSRWSATTSSTKCFQVDHVDEVSLPDVGAKRCWVRPVCIQTRLLSHQRRERIEDEDCLIEFVQGVSWAGYVSGLFSCNNVITTFLFIWRALIFQSWASYFPSHAFGNFRGQKLVACKFFELLSFLLLCYTSLSKELHWLIN